MGITSSRRAKLEEFSAKLEEFRELIRELNKDPRFTFNMSTIERIDDDDTMRVEVNKCTMTFTRNSHGKWVLLDNSKTPDKQIYGAHTTLFLQMELAVEQQQEQRPAWGPARPRADSGEEVAATTPSKKEKEEWVEVLHPKAPRSTLLF